MIYDPTSKFGNAKKASSRRPTPGGLYLGIVVRITGANVFVSVPKVAPQTVFGPCAVFSVFPKINQRVLCGFLDNRFEEVVILGRETTSKIISEVDSPLLGTDAANKVYVDLVVQNLKNYVDGNFD